MMIDTAPTDRPISGFDVFVAVLTVLAINLAVGIAAGVTIAVLWAGSGLAGTPTEFVQTDFYGVTGLTAAIDAVALIGLYFVGRRISRRPFGYFFAKVPAATMAKSVASVLALTVLVFVLEVTLKYGWHIDLSAGKTEQALMPKTWTQLGIALACGAAFIPFYEELLFRGYIFGWLRRVMPLWLAIALSAAIFALVHGLFLSRGGISGWIGTGEIFILGMLSAWWAARANSLWPAYAVHVVNNACTFALAFFLPNWP